MDLAAYIEELLFENDCVILPTIGGFIINLTTAQINFVEQQLSPPNKTVSFNPKLVNNDGLLVHYVSQKQHISYKQAQINIEAYTRQIENQLFDNKIVHFNNIGKLYFNSDSKLEFVPEETNFLRSTYGLPTIACTPILRNKDYLQAPKTANPTPVIRRSKRKRTAWITPLRGIVAASILLLFVTIPFIHKTFFSNKTTAENDILAEKPTSHKPKNKIVSAASILPVDNHTVAEKTIEEEEVAEKTPVSVSTTEETADYIIVLGAFGKEKNAYRLANKLAKDNYLPDVTIKNGLNRVGVQLNCTPEELANHLQWLQKNYNKKAWVVE